MKDTMNVKINKYLGTIELVHEGQRNATLYNTGLLLRTRFGQTGNALEEALSEVNQTKCTPPLSESEVRQIAESVDKSNVPIGESDTAHDRQRSRKTPKQRQRVVYAVRPSADPVPVESLLQKEVSLYPHCKEKVPSKTLTIGTVLTTFQTGGKAKASIDAIRSEPDKKKRGTLKEALPAIVFGSEPQTKRNNDACTANGVICLDFDHVPVDELGSAKEKIAALPYVFAVGLSVSGHGLFVLIACEGTPDLKKLIAALQADFPYKIDTNRSDLCGLRFATYDPDLIIKSGEVCPVALHEEVIIETVEEEPNDDGSKSREQKHAEWDKMFGGALTASEILVTDWGQLEWFVDGLIPEGFTVLAGQSKIGKSWFVLQLAICIAARLLFLNAFATSKHEVLYIALEDSERRIKERLKRLGLHVGDGLTIITEWADQWDALDYYLETHPNVKVVIIDTWGRFVAGICRNGNDYTEVTALAGHLHGLAKKHRAAIIAVTHTRKGATAQDWIDDPIGSKGLPAVADTILKLSRERNSTEGTLCLTGRDVDEKELTLAHDEKDWLWRLVEEHDDDGLTDDQREVLAVLKRIEQPATERELKRQSRVLQNMENVGEVLRQLIAMKKVRDTFRNGKVAYETPPVDTVDVDELPVNVGKYEQSVNGNTDSPPKTDPSDTDKRGGVWEYLETMRRTGSAPQQKACSVVQHETKASIEEPDADEIPPVDTVDVDELPVNVGKYEQSVNGSAEDAEENDISPSLVGEDGELQSPEQGWEYGANTEHLAWQREWRCRKQRWYH